MFPSNIIAACFQVVSKFNRYNSALGCYYRYYDINIMLKFWFSYTVVCQLRFPKH